MQPEKQSLYIKFDSLKEESGEVNFNEYHYENQIVTDRSVTSFLTNNLLANRTCLHYGLWHSIKLFSYPFLQ
jgi:hypothetical protein